MEKIYIWGAGNLANDIFNALDEVLPQYKENTIFKIEGIIDNNIHLYYTSFHGIEIVSPGEAIEKGFTNIIILNDAEYLIREQAENGYHIPASKVQTRWYLLKLLLQVKYQNTKDKEIKEVLEYWKSNDISLYNNFMPEKKQDYEVIWDKKINLPYIEFPTVEGKIKQMYYPRNYRFSIKDNKQVVEDILYEQLPMSPHLYTYKGHEVNDGDVILDGGVCEGNFSLRYVDVASKIYLVESDPNWKEALYYTFKEYQNKIVYCDKMLSNRDGYYSVSVDNLVKGRLDFLKMDIEGAEISGIEGAKRTLLENKVKCSICSYHKKEDEIFLKELFKSMGYDTSTSNGYLTFLWDKDIWYNLDFRKGVVYAY